LGLPLSIWAIKTKKAKPEEPKNKKKKTGWRDRKAAGRERRGHASD
jgi:hypothetical protein